MLPLDSSGEHLISEDQRLVTNRHAFDMMRGRGQRQVPVSELTLVAELLDQVVSMRGDTSMPREWTFDEVYDVMKGYQSACLLAAAAELDLFSALQEPLTASDLAQRRQLDPRAVTMLSDALVALDLLKKQSDRYVCPESIRSLLAGHGPGSILAMAQHQANCQRRWTNLAAVIKSGQPADRVASIRGEVQDQAAFIEAMDNIASQHAAALIEELPPISFEHLLDLGGASGTWTIAFLKRHPGARATLFDLPHVLPLAEKRLTEAGLRDRVQLVAGDFLVDPLPTGADLAWVSAIIHQNSRSQNRQMFGALAEALCESGTILIRDVVMNESKTAPVHGALFAIHMLVATEGGGTYTYDEVRQDLEASGFSEARLCRDDDGMNAIISASKRRR